LQPGQAIARILGGRGRWRLWLAFRGRPRALPSGRVRSGARAKSTCCGGGSGWRCSGRGSSRRVGATARVGARERAPWRGGRPTSVVAAAVSRVLPATATLTDDVVEALLHLPRVLLEALIAQLTRVLGIGGVQEKLQAVVSPSEKGSSA